ncbi:F-box domain containing protein [Tanacetum coccineum]
MQNPWGHRPEPYSSKLCRAISFPGSVSLAGWSLESLSPNVTRLSESNKAISTKRQTRRTRDMDYKQVEKRMNDEIDRLSNLPDDLIHKILSFVGIKCAIELSALSSRWRYIWTSMPYLDFSKWFQSSSILIEFGPGSIRQIMIYASSHNVQQLDIVYLLADDSIKFPLPLIRSQSLKHLSFKKEPYSWNSKNSERSVLGLTSTLELPALTTPYLHDTTLFCDGNTDIISDAHIGLFSKCANLKNLTLKSCKVIGLNRLNFCHPLLSNLTVEDVQGSFNVVDVDVPQLKNLTIDSGRKKYKYLISAPGLVSLLYKGHHCLDLSTDGIHLLEKADLCVTGNASARKIVCLFQHLQSVKFLTLNLEMDEDHLMFILNMRGNVEIVVSVYLN